MEEDTTRGVAKLIAKLTDSSKKDDPMPGQAEDLSTPLKSFEQELHEEAEHDAKVAEVTFKEKATTPPVSVSASITSEPRLSRRSKTRGGKPSDRTSESFSRADQAFLRWEDVMYDSLFRDSPELGGDPTAIASLTLASGRHVKAGDSRGDSHKATSRGLDLRREGGYPPWTFQAAR